MHKIVFDIDDVLWGLNQRVAEKYQIPIDKVTHFDLTRSALSEEERRQFSQAYCDAETFTDIEFYPGVEDLLELEKLGATVYIDSCANSDEVVEQKYREIKRILPQMNPAHICIYNPNSNKHSKMIGEDVLIFVDDGPHNVAKSLAKYTIVPKKPWNTGERTQAMLARSKSQVIVAEDFPAIIEKITEILQKEA